MNSLAPFAEPRRWLGFTLSVAALVALFRLLPTGSAPDGVEVSHWSSILPPILAVLLATFFRQLLVALGAAILLGSVLAFGWEIWRGLEAFIWANLSTPFNLYIIAFTFALVGMVNVISRCGGTQGLADAVTRVARDARSTRIATGLMGLALFFDDYANSVVVGTTMRRLSDRMRISRERLAYIVDSTAAPIAGVSLISTWIAYEVGLFGELSQQLELPWSGYELFLSILPLRFYCITALIVVFASAALRRDFGPMLRAEQRAAETGQTLREGATLLASESIDATEPPDDAPRRWWNAAVPILFVLFGVIAGILWTGRHAIAEAGRSMDLLDGEVWRLAFGAGNSATVLFWVSMAGSLLAIAMARAQRILTLGDATRTWLQTIPTMKLAVAILVMAWGIKSVCSELHTDGYLISLVGDELPLAALPLVTFLIGAATAFATGTSWGTMGILLPVALPLAHHMGATEAEGGALFFLVGAAVLDGAIFGDHCSPISDTTVLSSVASGCDHLDHVQTQVPYAALAMVLAAGFGYTGLALGLPLWLSYPLLIAGVVGAFLVVGTPLQDPEPPASGPDR